jgi:AcrR family transcriptional regulator
VNAKETREQIIRDAKSSLILDAARKVFAEKGYNETKLDEIAAIAGFSKAALYNYYQDKESIFLSLAERDFEFLFIELDDNIQSGTKFVYILEKIIITLCKFFCDHVAFMHIVPFINGNAQVISREYHEKRHNFFKKNFSIVLNKVVGMVTEARRMNEFDSKLDDMIIARFILSIVKDTIFRCKFNSTEENMDSEIGNIITFVSHGMNIR